MKTWTFTDVRGEEDDTTSILRTRFYLSCIINLSSVAELKYGYISQEMCQIKMDQHHLESYEHPKLAHVSVIRKD